MKIKPSARSSVLIGLDRFSPLALVVAIFLPARSISRNCGMLNADGLSTTQSPPSVQTIACTAVQRIALAPFRSSADTAADIEANRRTGKTIARHFRIAPSSRSRAPMLYPGNEDGHAAR